MLLPMKAVTRHRGMAQTIAPLTHPTMDMIKPSNCIPVVAMVIYFSVFVADGPLIVPQRTVTV